MHVLPGMDGPARGSGYHRESVRADEVVCVHARPSDPVTGLCDRRRRRRHHYQAGDRAMLYVVVAGGLQVCDRSDGRCLLELGEGEAFGFSFCFGKEPLAVDLVAASRSQIVRIAPSVARKMRQGVRRRAVSAGLPCLMTSVPRLTELVWQLDWSCEYHLRVISIQTEIPDLTEIYLPFEIPMPMLMTRFRYVHAVAGELVAAPDEEISHLKMVLAGRLRGTVVAAAPTTTGSSCTRGEGLTAGQQQQPPAPVPSRARPRVAELTAGATLGLVELVTGARLTTEWRAVRDSNVARMPAQIFHMVAAKYPCVYPHMCRMLAQRSIQHADAWGGHSVGHDELHQQLVAGTVALIPITTDAGLNVQFVAETMSAAASAMGLSAATVDFELLKAGLGSRIHDTFGENAINGWLANQENAHDMVIYVADQGDPAANIHPTAWTHRCVRQADVVLYVACSPNADEATCTITPFEKGISDTTNARQELVILHLDPSDDYRPVGTKHWLSARRVQRHHHLRVHTDTEAGLQFDRTNVHSDFARLVRWLMGRSVGLVLGGGGARGCSHFGVLRALEEANVPVDLIGGTSIGAFVGALRSGTTNFKTSTQRGRAIGRILGSYWAYLRDLTPPYASFFSGSTMNFELQQLFGTDVCIEDLWLPFYAVTTNVNEPAQNPVVHRNGRAWRYVRASMSLQGYLPPLCDTNPATGKVNLLLDGGYVSNLPVDSMRAQGAAFVIAVDVASVSESANYDYGDSLSGWWWLWQKVKYRPLFMWMPWSSNRPKVLTMGELAAELSYCADYLKKKSSYNSADLVLRPPVNAYGLLQFDSFDEIMQHGFDHASAVISLLSQLGERGSVNSKQTDVAAALHASNDTRAFAWDKSRVIARPSGAAQLATYFLRVYSGDASPQHLTLADTTGAPGGVLPTIPSE
jgi:predicted acylesterase/phospholipase RssA/CRP-like cAMP-binding protein